MKKFLSLALALVMTMSLVTVSAGAKDFTDGEKITYTEAVDVVSAVKVVDGYADGSFNPTATLTRGAAAKIICNLILGPTTAAELSADTAPYKDVPANHVFAGYIAFCQQQEIISGYADGTFRPAGTLTSYAFMKMLLGALGYDSEVEGYVGNNWSIQVAKRALNIDLDDGLTSDFVGTKPVTREEACLYAFNMMQADMVEYGTKTTVSVNGAQVVVGDSKADTVGYPASKDFAGRADNTTLQFAEKYFEDLKLASGETDAFERPSNVWTLDKDEIGTYAKAADAVYTVKTESGDIYKDLGLTKAADYSVFVDGVAATGADKTFSLVRGSSTGIGANGVIVEVYKDAEKIVMINTYAGKITGVEEETKRMDAYVEVENIASGDRANYETEGFDVDEIVLYTFSNKPATKNTVEGIQSVVKAESVTGTVSKYNFTKSFTMGDETYKYSANIVDDKLVEVDSEIVAYTDAYGFVIYVDFVDSMVKDMYYVVDETNDTDKWGKTTYFAKVLGMDGVVTEVTLKDDKSAGFEGDFVTMTKDKNDKATLHDVERNFTNVKAGTIAPGAEDIILKNGKVSKVGTYFNDNSTMFLLYSDKDEVAKVYEGIKNVPTIKSASEVAYDVLVKDASSKNAIVLLHTDGAKKTNMTEETLYILGADPKYTTDKDDTWYQFDAIVNGEAKTIEVKYAGNEAVVETLCTKVNVLATEYSIDGHLVTDVTVGGHDASTISKYSDGVITFNNGSFVADPDTTKVYAVDEDGVATEKTLSYIRKDTTNKYYKQINYVLNDDADTVLSIFLQETAR